MYAVWHIQQHWPVSTTPGLIGKYVSPIGRYVSISPISAAPNGSDAILPIEPD